MKSEPILSHQEISALREQAHQLQSSIIASHKLDSRDAGWLATSALGSGMDYAESRLYQQGDEPRTINWRLSARSTETYVKSYHMEARPSLCIVLDQRRPMIFGTRSRLKATQALRLATILVFAAEQHRLKLHINLINRAGEWLEVQTAEEFLAKTNQRQWLQEQLQDGVQRAANQMSIGDALTKLSQSIERGALLYLISDFHDLNESHQKRLFQLQDHYFVQALHITDPAEEALQKAPNNINSSKVSKRQKMTFIQKLGGMYLQDMQSDASLKVSSQGRSENNITRLNDALNEHVENIKQVFLKSSVYYSPISTVDETLYSSIVFPLGH